MGNRTQGNITARARTTGLAARLVFGLGMGCAACAGGQTGEGPPEGKDDGPCDETKRDIELDDDSALGFAPSRVLELATGPVTEPLHWLAASEYPFGPEQGTGSATLEVTEAATVARHVDREPREGEDDPNCDDSLEIDVVLGVRSAGGALDESLPVTLSAVDPYATSFEAELDPAELDGAFAFEEGAIEGTVTLTLRGWFTEHGSSGEFGESVQQRHGNHGSISGGSLAAWPTEQLCHGTGPTVPPDRGDASVDAALELVNGATGLVLVTPDAQRIAVEVGVITDGAPVCVASGSDAETRPGGSVFTPVVLSVIAADGTVSIDYPGELMAIAASDGSLSEATIAVRCAGSPGDDFSLRCGDWGVPTAGYDALSLVADLSFRPPAGAPAVSGTLTVRGHSDACYDSTPDDGDDCSDGEPAELAVIRLESE